MTFSVDRYRVLYAGRALGESRCRPGFQQYAFEDSPLGEGANGVTYRVQHRVLGVNQVVKLYFPGSDVGLHKARLEAVKNSDPRVRDVVAQVHDAGIYRYPTRIAFSVMESVSDIQTLGEWLDQRDAEWIFYRAHVNNTEYSLREKDDQKSVIQRIVIAEALNVAAGYIGAVVKLHAAGVTHGDLNPGNILIHGEGREGAWKESGIQHLLPNRVNLADEKLEKLHGLDNRYFGINAYSFQPGSLAPLRVKLIDLGASKAPGTESAVGAERETWFIVENLSRILKPLFDGKGSFRQYLALEKWDIDADRKSYKVEGEERVADPGVLAGEIYRLLCVISLFLGHSHNSRAATTDAPAGRLRLDHTDLGIVSQLVSGDFEGLRDQIFALDVLAVLDAMDSPSVTKYVDWDSVLLHWTKLHPAFAEYRFTESDFGALRFMRRAN